MYSHGRTGLSPGAQMIRMLAMTVLLASAQLARAETGPGESPVDALTASTLFDRVCMQSLPGFGGAAATLAELGFVPHPESGTFYDGRNNISFKMFADIGARYCSMVFGSRDDAFELGLMLATTVQAASPSAEVRPDPETGKVNATPRPGVEFEFFPSGDQGGTNYFRARLVVTE